jgi:hypothetical protein
MKSSTKNHPSSERIYQGTIVIPYVKVTSEKFRRIGDRFSIRTLLKTKHALLWTFMTTGPARDTQQTKWCVYSIPCDRGGCYISEASRPLEVRMKEHSCNLTEDLLEKSKLAEHACEEGHKICWNETNVSYIEPDTSYGKYKESIRMSLIIRSANPA